MKKIWVVGIGPGDEENMTLAAKIAIEQADVLCGYTGYIRLVEPLFPGKEVLSTGMTREEERCRMALETADTGKSVAMVCSGDAGVYGMAGLVLEMGEKYPEVKVEVVPGVSAAMAGGALLGAPLMHDFAVISLSDLLTPWELIEKRLAYSAEADFVLCLYNPASKTRTTQLAQACRIVMRHREPDTPCGWVKKVGREGEETGILTLKELEHFEADMFTTVFIGNSSTKVVKGQMVTPRGYGERGL